MEDKRAGYLQLAILIVVGCILSIGLLMIFSTTSAEILDNLSERSRHYAMVKQVWYGFSGVAFGSFLYRLGYKRLLVLSPALISFFIVLLILSLIPGIGKEVNGSRRWLSVAGISFQPSEFVKYLIPVFFIHKFFSHSGKPFLFQDFLKLIGIIAIPMVLILIEPNNGTTAVIGMTLLVLFGLMGISYKYWALPLATAFILGAAFASQLPYVTARINVYLHPELDLRGKGHQPYQAKIAAGSGQMFGKGPGNSLQKLSYLPEAQNDYIAAIYAEEFGFAGMTILIVLYMLLTFLGFSIAYRARDLESFFLASSITFLIAFQAFLNLGVVSGLLPSTGLNLPFFSQGGTSLMANLGGLSMLLSIAVKKDL
ncbi:Lipid II flippase FtsW [Chlamydiales bacterium STE3]|nr:Lipid II flippase FtsW [Chlamydiales bacterium STE3]